MARNGCVHPAPSVRLGRRVLVLAACGLLLAACASPAVVPTATPTTALVPQLRVRNAGTYPIEGLVILFPEDRVEFGDVAADTATEYRDVPHGVYRYAAYQFMVNGERVDLPVIDWVGEEPVPGQAFTYVLDLDPARGQWEMLQLIEASVDR